MNDGTTTMRIEGRLTESTAGAPPSAANRHTRCVESRSTRTTEIPWSRGSGVGEYSLSGVSVTRVLARVARS